MPINAHPDYLAAEAEYLRAETLEEKIEKLKKMISLAPSHKGAENLKAQLKTRLKKLVEKQEKSKKSGKSKKTGIKKEEMQAVIVGKTNTGKSSLLTILTNARPKISEEKFTTKEAVVGMMEYQGASIQLIEIPAIESEYYDKGMVNTADTILILITNLEQLKEIEEKLKTSSKKKIVVYNLKNKEENSRRIESTLKSRKYNFIILDLEAPNQDSLNELKEKLFASFDKIRVYTKEPGKEKSDKPIILDANTTVQEVAEKILKGFSKNVRETKIWGPSSKFPGQKVGLHHKLKDLDIVEFRTR